MFELGVLALARALDSGAFARGWTLNGIGTLESGHRVALGGAANLDLLSRAEQHRTPACSAATTSVWR